MTKDTTVASPNEDRASKRRSVRFAALPSGLFSETAAETMRACHEEYPHIVPVLVTVDGLFLLYLSLSLFILYLYVSHRIFSTAIPSTASAYRVAAWYLVSPSSCGSGADDGACPILAKLRREPHGLFQNEMEMESVKELEAELVFFPSSLPLLCLHPCPSPFLTLFHILPLTQRAG